MTDDADSLNASIAPCLSPLNASIRGPKYLKIKRRSKSLDSRLKISGMTWEGVDARLNFRHDGGEALSGRFYII